MSNNLKERYKVDSNNVDESYIYHLGLKSDTEFEKRVDETFIEIVKLFKEKYPNVSIEPPRGREKSDNSLRNKLENLEIERLCKLYAIEGLSDSDKDKLYRSILAQVDVKYAKSIENLMYEPIDNLDIIDKIAKDENIPEKTMTALLRIINTKLIRENIQNKEDLQEELDKKYGKTAAIATKQLKNDLLKWDSIEKLSDKDIEVLHNPFEFLKIKDLRGIKMVIANIPDVLNDAKPNSTEIEKIIQKRKYIEALLQSENDSLENSEPNDYQNDLIKTLEDNISGYTDLARLQLSREFMTYLSQDEELLERLNLSVIEYKHKSKQNGYIAEHMKFCYRDKPDYKFELQIRSIYRENLTKANGPAAHDKRSGKKRIFPSLSSKSFIEDLKKSTPKYTIIMNENNEYKAHKCSMAENLLEYYMGYIHLDEKEYNQVMKYVEDEENIQKA